MPTAPMKFMIINTPNGHNYSKTGPTSSLDAGPLKSLLKSGVVEAAYVTVAGGHIYVVRAKDTEQLVRLVRGNPFFHDSNTEVIPIMDAADFVEGYQKHTRGLKK